MSCHGQPCKIPSAGANALGFASAASCCKLPCPAFPIHTVKICVLINSKTAVKIQQGCATEDSDDEECDASYSSGQTYDTWGRSCRVVSWSRQVPDDAFIRIRFVPSDEDEDCEDSSSHHRTKNQLLKFEVDGADVRRIVEAVNRYPHGTYNCIKAACTLTEGPSCCSVGSTGPYEVNWEIDDIVRGAEIVVGPMSDVPYSYPPPITVL